MLNNIIRLANRLVIRIIFHGITSHNIGQNSQNRSKFRNQRILSLKKIKFSLIALALFYSTMGDINIHEQVTGEQFRRDDNVICSEFL